MRPLGIALLLAASACGSPGEPVARNEARPPADAPPPRESATAQPVANAVAPAEASADPGAAGMSPSRRRAYHRGYRDCRAGRYEPDRYSEAYRIGCAAAQQ